jgi:ribonuclease HI
MAGTSKGMAVKETWICYTDGGARGNPGPAGIGVVIMNPKGEVVGEVAEHIGNATNNFAEYAAVARMFAELKRVLGKKTRTLHLDVRLDSELVKKQLSGEYQVREASLIPLFMEIHNHRVSDFPHVTFTHVPREKNKHADKLVNTALDYAGRHAT